MFHPDAFASLEEAFDPWRNADYGARFLVQLRDQTGSWAAATADYHSATPELGTPYAAKVRAALAEEQGGGTGFGSPLPRAGGGAAELAPVVARPAFGRVALSMPQETPASRGPLLAAGGAAFGLDAYRTHPVRLASRSFQPQAQPKALLRR